MRMLQENEMAWVKVSSTGVEADQLFVMVMRANLCTESLIMDAREWAASDISDWDIRSSIRFGDHLNIVRQGEIIYSHPECTAAQREVARPRYD